MKNLAPIVLFVYNRPKHTQDMIEALAKNNFAKESDVYIFSDNAKKEKDIENVRKVRTYIDSIKQKNWFANVYIEKAEKNKGLAKSVINGVTKVINKYDKVIVLEDDLIPSKVFLEYMNKALDFYEKKESIWSISGYNIPIQIPKNYKFDIYLGYRGCSWGWATWKDRWNTVDWKVSDYKEFKNNYKKRKQMNRGGPDMAQMLDSQMQGLCDSWAIRWCYEQSKQNKYTIYPVKSLVINQGLDGTGTHSGTTKDFDVEISERVPELYNNLPVDKEITTNFYNKYKLGIKQNIIEILMILKLEKIIGLRQTMRSKKTKN